MSQSSDEWAGTLTLRMCSEFSQAGVMFPAAEGRWNTCLELQKLQELHIIA